LALSIFGFRTSSIPVGPIAEGESYDQLRGKLGVPQTIRLGCHNLEHDIHAKTRLIAEADADKMFETSKEVLSLILEDRPPQKLG
jgi:hypothetical protein